MPTRTDDVALPSSVRRVEALDPEVHRLLADDFGRLARAGAALAWAQGLLPALVAAGSPHAVLAVVVDEARALTGAPQVWALTWTGDIQKKQASFRAFVGGETTDAVPAPSEISDTVIAKAVATGQPVWSDDASADARFTAAESVQAFALRSVGCVPLGDRGALYLHDPEQPGRFSAEHRIKLGALCRTAAPFLGTTSTPATRRRPAEPLPGLVGTSPAMLEVYDAVRAFAPMPWPVLILGESGTGKELVAKALHTLSPRADQPFVALNCGTISAQLAESTLFGHERGSFTGAERRHGGVVERVGRGTLFLDEVAELDPRLQVKLLRLIAEGTYERVGGERELPFRGRVIAATLRPVDDPETRGAFREDLYYRLAACVVKVPPLRDRLADVPDLAAHLLERALKDLGGGASLDLSQEVSRKLSNSTWKGNVRELENTLRSAIAHAVGQRAKTITPEHLAPGTASSARPTPSEEVDLDGMDLQAAVDAFQRRAVTAALESCDGNRTRAAEKLGVSRQWLHRLLSRWEDG